MTPEQHALQRLWVAQSLQAESQRERHHDTYPLRAPRMNPSAEPSRREAGDDAE